MQTLTGGIRLYRLQHTNAPEYGGNLFVATTTGTRYFVTPTASNINWIPIYDYELATKYYVDQAVTGSGGTGITADLTTYTLTASFISSTAYLQNEITSLQTSTGTLTGALLWGKQGTNTYLSNPGDNVGIGVLNPTNTFHVRKGIAGVTADPDSIAVFENSSHGYFAILTPNSNESGIVFGNPGLAYAGGIYYNNAANLNGLTFRTSNNTTKMIVSSGGNVGIGTTVPTSLLTVSGNLSTLTVPQMYVTNGNPTNGAATWAAIGEVSRNCNILVYNANKTGTFLGLPANTTTYQYSNNTGYAVGTADNYPLNFLTNAASKMTILGGGNVGIGIQTPDQKLSVNGNLTVTGNSYFSGDIGIGTPVSIGQIITASGNSVYYGTSSFNPAGATYGVYISDSNMISSDESGLYWTGSDYPMAVYDNTNGRMFYGNSICVDVVNGGYVGIGLGANFVPSGNYLLEVDGEFSARAKSFVIDHPTKKGKLRHGSLEGPEYGVYIRGKLENSNEIQIPDYWDYLVHKDSIEVQLTPFGKYQKLYVNKIEDGKIFIIRKIWGIFKSKKINCYYMINASRKDVKLKVEDE